jgi:hypothetical protein
MKTLLASLFSLFYINAFSQDNSEIKFSLLRQNDEIEIKNANSLYDHIKQLKLADNASLSFGGSWRFQYESFINEQFQDVPNQDNLWFLQRVLLHAHLRLGSHFEVFTELNSSLVSNKEALTPVDKDELSFNQFFARYNFNDNWNMLLGRQNIRLGSGRLVDVREGPNVRLSFDMAQLQYKDPHTEFTAFYAIPVQLQSGAFDNKTLDTDETLSALYWIQNWSNNTHTDLYILYKEEANKTWNAGTANDNRMSFGLRHYGTWKSLNYNNEFVYQLGSFGNQDITAWTASFNIEKQFKTSYPFTLGIKTEAISGDTNANDDQLNTFDALYPRGAYFGRVARFGPSNLIDVHPYFETQYGLLNLTLDYVAFWRFSDNDGIYNPALILDYPSTNDERFIGHQIGVIAGFEVNNFINLELESNIIFPGAFLQQQNQGNTLYHFVLTTEFKF